MGQCYDVTANINPVNEKEFLNKSKEFLQSAWVNAKVKYDSVDDIMEFLLAAHQKIYERKGNIYTSGFDASYSWEHLLYEWFQAVKETLSNGDYIEVWPDFSHWKEEV